MGNMNMAMGGQSNPYAQHTQPAQQRQSFGGGMGNAMMGNGYGQPQAQGNPYMQAQPAQGRQNSMNPYMQPQPQQQQAAPNQYMQRQASAQNQFGAAQSQGNPYMQNRPQAQAQANPYMQTQQPQQGNPYAAQPVANNPYMSGQPQVAAQGGFGGGGGGGGVANPFR